MEMIWPAYDQAVALATDEVRVIAVPLDEFGVSEDELLATLSAEERERAAQFQWDKPRRQFIVGRSMLRWLLGAHLEVPASDVQIIYDARGKPRIGRAIDSPKGELARPHFNLAHSEEIVLVAMAMGCEVGVDVERLRAVSHLEQIARRYFHATELSAIMAVSQAERDAAFLRCWTGKEAVVKAAGTGLSESLVSFQVPTGEHHGTWVDLPTTGGRALRCWLQPLRPHADYVGSVACVGELRSLSCFKLGSDTLYAGSARGSSARRPRLPYL